MTLAPTTPQVDRLVNLYGADVVNEAMDKLIQLGRSRMMELRLSGFGTRNTYDTNFLHQMKGLGRAFELRSTLTGTTYGFVVAPNATVTDRSVDVILVMIGEGILTPTQMTMQCLVATPGPDGIAIEVMPGWREQR